MTTLGDLEAGARFMFPRGGVVFTVARVQGRRVWVEGDPIPYAAWRDVVPMGGAS